ncbi:hypothetical protein D922_01088 [Enterococcus faecalis 06-MB-DW-09]|nr:hypothetical protein D922_01088 [Enterococcus faecalis 06-MB-DW-09]
MPTLTNLPFFLTQVKEIFHFIYKKFSIKKDRHNGLQSFH